MDQHTSSLFEKDLTALRDALMQMGGLVEKQLDHVRQILHSEANFFNDVGATELAINQAQVAIDHQCLEIIAMRQPVGIDLRRVLASMHIINDLERMGDELKKCASWGNALNADADMRITRRITLHAMLGILTEMLHDGLAALAREDISQENNTAALDLQLDELFRQTVEAQQMFMQANPHLTRFGIDTIFIAKSFERVGDHLKNIAESVHAMVTGVDVRKR